MGGMFCNGDRVLYVNPLPSGTLQGDSVGTIRDDSDQDSLGVEFDNYFGAGHDLYGLCQYGYGWYISHSLLRLIDESLTIDGNISDIINL